MEQWVEYAGRLHVLLVHFPIGLLITAGLIELVGICRRLKAPMTTSVVLAWCGAFAAVVVATQGWILAGDTKHPGAEQLVELHRWAGVTTAALAVVAAWLGLLSIRRRAVFRWPFRLFIFLTAITAAVAAHWGGSLIYGEKYFLPPINQTAEQTKQAHDSHEHHSHE